MLVPRRNLGAVQLVEVRVLLLYEPSRRLVAQHTHLRLYKSSDRSVNLES